MSFIDENENLDIFTDNEFSTVALIDSATSTIFELSGIFDENYQDLFDGYGGEGQSSEGRKYCFQVQSQYTENLYQGDRLRIKGKNYQVVSFQPKYDGKLTNIVLKQDFN